VLSQWVFFNLSNECLSNPKMNTQIDVMIGQGIQAFQSGNIQSAKLILQKVLNIYPASYSAYQIMGLIEASQENHTEAVKYFKKALKIQDGDPALLYNLGQALLSCQKPAEAIPYLQKFTKNSPGHSVGWSSAGRALSLLGRHQEALLALDNALKYEPNSSQILTIKGLSLSRLGKFEGAVNSLLQALANNPGNFTALLELGVAYGALSRYQEALAINDKTIEIDPRDARVWYNRGIYFVGLERYEEALNANDQAIQIDPSNGDAWLNKGAILRKFKRYEEAFVATDRAIALSPTNSDAWLNMAVILRELKNIPKSIEASEKSIKFNSKNIDAWFNKGIALYELKEYEKAISTLKKAIELGAKNDYLRGTLISAKTLIADWGGISEELNELFTEIKQHKHVVASFLLLALIDDPNLHLEAAKLYVENIAGKNRAEARPLDQANSKIRVGYFSSDFREHAVGMLMVNAIELHNKDEFEVYGFSLLGAKEGDQIRSRFTKAFDQFFDLENLSDDEIILRAKECHLDIAIDLNGHTSDGRTEIFANRVAPIQVNFLGYPGTMGANYMDYIIADKVVIPVEAQNFYAEKVAYLPNSYLMYDSKQSLSAYIPTREDLGLPEKAFVFCAFNNGYKISKEVLSSWSAILGGVDGSVLWLTENNADFKKNILQEFSALGILPGRVIFAPRLDSIEDHLTRIKQADLFLDTWPYNAHSTAMDVLHAGVPMISKIGKSFAARVGASLLTTLELPELIASSQEEYETLAIQLAKDPIKLNHVKDSLNHESKMAKLFDTQKFIKDLERLYKKIQERQQQGLQVDHLYVD